MEKLPNNNDIRQIGDFLPIDEEGYIQNTLSPDNIQENWKPVVDDVVKAYKEHFGDKVVSVYLRGSVAKGLAIEGISDVDNFAVIDLPREELDLSWQKDFLIEMKNKYPFTDDVEVGVFTLEDFNQGRNPKMFAKTQGLLVYGENLTKDLPEYKIGRDMVAHGFGLQRGMELNRNHIEKNKDNSGIIKSRCKVMMKRIVRVGMELVMVRANKYTRDLFLCWKEFSRFYPDKSEEMMRALKLSVAPTDNIDEINEIFDNLGSWLVEEFNKQF